MVTTYETVQLLILQFLHRIPLWLLCLRAIIIDIPQYFLNLICFFLIVHDEGYSRNGLGNRSYHLLLFV